MKYTWKAFRTSLAGGKSQLILNSIPPVLYRKIRQEAQRPPTQQSWGEMRDSFQGPSTGWPEVGEGPAGPPRGPSAGPCGKA